MNSVSLIGRLTKDPVGGSTNSGIQYARFTIAIDRIFNTQQKSTDFIPITVWRQSANYALSYLKKGFLVSVSGSIESGSYLNKEGQTVYTLNVNGFQIRNLERRNDFTQTETLKTAFAEKSAAPAPQKETTFFEEEKEKVDWNFDDLE